MLQLTEEQYERAEALFARARALEPGEWSPFLARECADDPAVRELVVQLLPHDRTLGVLDEELPLPLAPEATARPLPAFIGPYRVRSLLGEGGMGVVYLAEQESLQRPVALKLIRGRLPSDAARRRFEREAVLLGLLNHPGIAQVYDAGTAELEGEPRPYLAMELVPGAPLTQHAEQRGLDRRARLELFAGVCEAVQHAHERGVVHRDLKPDNILVDAEGQPKVLDFGVARALASDRARSLQTEEGRFVGTLRYMSPEQAGGIPGEVDARTDVYSLGAVLYELLAGRPPFAFERETTFEALRILREEEPRSLRSFGRHLAGDLDTIVGRALAKERHGRYASAADLAADLRRHLAGETILARPPGPLERVRFAIRRNPTAALLIVALAAGLVLTWIGREAPATVAFALGLVGLGLGLVRAERARREAHAARLDAEREAGKARAVGEFLESMLASPAPDAQGRDVKVADLLEGAGRRLTEEPVGEPEVQAALHHTLGVTWRGLGQWERAAEQLAAALEGRTEVLGTQHLETLRSAGWLALVRRDQGRWTEAEELWRGVIAGREHLLGAAHADTLTARGQLGLVLKGKGEPAEAEELMRAVVADMRVHLGSRNWHTLTALVNLGNLLRERGQAAEAIELLREAVEGMTATRGPEQPDALAARNNLASALQASGELEEARALYCEVLAVQERVLGGEHPWTLSLRNNLGHVNMVLGAHDEALHHMQTAAAGFAARFGERHPATLVSSHNLGRLLVAQGRHEEALPRLREADRLASECFPAGERQRWILRTSLAQCLSALGRAEEAEPLLVEAAEQLTEILGPEAGEAREAARELAALRGGDTPVADSESAPSRG